VSNYVDYNFPKWSAMSFFLAILLIFGIIGTIKQLRSKKKNYDKFNNEKDRKK
jgi:hypothetical protein